MRKLGKEKNFAVTSRQIQTIDKKAARDFGIATLFLMENAGRGICLESLKFFKADSLKSVNIFCGKGNNGGDGFVAARYLLRNGIKVKVFLFAKKSELKYDALANFNRLKKLRADISKVLDFKIMQKLKKRFLNCDLIIDSLFGVGLKGVIKEPFFSLINFLNESGKPILSVDVPSGLDATTGKIHGAAIKAAKTITFSLPKKGFYRGEAMLYCGKIVVKKIGIPRRLINEIRKHS